jgi:hypothetical protein
MSSVKIIAIQVTSTVFSLQSAYPALRLNRKELHFAQILCMFGVRLRIKSKFCPKQHCAVDDRAEA